MAHPVLGMPALIEPSGLDANVALCRELDLAFVELNMNDPAYLPDVLPAERLRRVRETTGVGFTLHLPESLDLAAFQRPIREGHLACCEEAIAWAAAAGIRTATMHLHPGVYYTLPDRRVWLYERHRVVFLAAVEASFRRLLPAARTGGVALCIENGGPLSQPFMREALERLLALDREAIRLTWDVGHDAASGFPDRALFEALSDRIGHVHLHDAAGKDAHRALFTGCVDVVGTLALAAKLGVAVVIETKTAESLTESVREMDRRGLR